MADDAGCGWAIEVPALPQEPWFQACWLRGSRVFAGVSGVGIGARRPVDATVVLEGGAVPVVGDRVDEEVFVGEVVTGALPHQAPVPRRPPPVVVVAGREPAPVRIPVIRPGGRLPKGFSILAHTAGPYDYIGQDGRYLIVDTAGRRVLPGTYEESWEAFEAAEVLNESWWLSKGKIHKALKWSQRKVALGSNLARTPGPSKRGAAGR